MMQFGAQSTADEVLTGQDLSERFALVTGVSSGLGLETARALASHGAQVIGAVRDLAKASAAVGPIREQIGDRLTLVELDLASLASVRAAAAAIAERFPALDLLIANAGIMATPFGQTEDGFELQFGTNHLGHFLLANLLTPHMRSGARLISLSSSGHQSADIDLDDPNFIRRPYAPFTAYGASKTASILFAVEFDRRYKSRGLHACAVHPGVIVTELLRHMSQESIQQMKDLALAQTGAEMEFKSIPQGAATTLWAAVTAPADLIGGRYCEDCHVAPVGDLPRKGVRAYAMDRARAERLWTLSEALVRLSACA